MTHSPEELDYLIDRLRCYEPALYALFEERAAIIEYDGGIPREEAERLAYESMEELLSWR